MVGRILFLMLLLSTSAFAQRKSFYDFPTIPRWKDEPHSTEWDNVIEEELKTNHKELFCSLPKDMYTFCPNYERMNDTQKMTVWKLLLSGIAEKESSFDPSLDYTEKTIFDSKGKNVVSRGLLQISKESANNNYGCNIQDEKELHDPKVNISCGLQIMQSLVLGDGVMRDRIPVFQRTKDDNGWRGLARYWSVFRNPIKLQHIQTSVASFPMCTTGNFMPKTSSRICDEKPARTNLIQRFKNFWTRPEDEIEEKENKRVQGTGHPMWGRDFLDKAFPIRTSGGSQ